LNPRFLEGLLGDVGVVRKEPEGYPAACIFDLLRYNWQVGTMIIIQEHPIYPPGELKRLGQAVGVAVFLGAVLDIRRLIAFSPERECVYDGRGVLEGGDLLSRSCRGPVARTPPLREEGRASFDSVNVRIRDCGASNINTPTNNLIEADLAGAAL